MSERAGTLISPFENRPGTNLPGPRLGILWQKRRGHIKENFRALLTEPSAPKDFQAGENFRDCYVKGRVPRPSMAASIVWHVILVVLLIQFGALILTGGPAQNVENLELTWSGPVNDLPLISPTHITKLPSPPGNPNQLLTRRGADAFHPRQTLISAPKVPTHPRQTLVRPDAPPIPPKFLPPMPNVVMWNGVPEAPRRTLTAEKMLKVPRLKAQPAAPVASLNLPNVEKNLADINFAASEPVLARPALTISSGHATVAAPRKSDAVASGTDPPPTFGSDNSNQRVIALSATPGPVAPDAPVPAGNVAARVSISPDGPTPGAPNGSENSLTANGSNRGIVVPGISVSGGDPAHSPGVSGLGNSNSPGNSSRPIRITPGTLAKHDPSPDSSAGKPFSERIKPGSPPEHIFGSRTVYTLNVNMPNLSSATGSWILKFAELDENSNSASHAQTGASAAAHSSALSGPQALRKVDPQYPPEEIKAHVEGEVILYAIIREDGSVDSIQVARPLDPVLDKSAMDALAEWKFTPAQRNGVPVALEAIIHIPFRSTKHDYY
jgi:TonB family protein